MRALTLKIHDFKCFRDAEFTLRNLTILTGANASGKSSVIQALWFLKQIALAAVQQRETVALAGNKTGLKLGKVKEVIHYAVRDKSDAFTIELDNSKVVVREFNEDSNEASFEVNKKSLFIEDMLLDNMLYLSAERLGPREESVRVKVTKDEIDCGYDGSNTASVLDANFMASADKDRSLDTDNKKDKFSVLLDTWVDYIFPGIIVRVVNLSETKCKVVMRSRVTGNAEIGAPNIGFGITYVLPILVEALLMRQGGCLIVENPEVHLHAKAQSNLGYFLGVIAGSGVRVVIETHSEHIVNGVRRAIVAGKRLNPEDACIYYMSTPDLEVNVDTITIDAKGNLSSFPVDFFDQQRQDSKTIFDSVRNELGI